MSKPISLSDEQLSAVMRAVEPLQPGERSVVLSKLADHLRAAGEVGDGQLFRLLRELVRQYFRPPTVSPEPVHYRRNIGEALE